MSGKILQKGGAAEGKWVQCYLTAEEYVDLVREKVMTGKTIADILRNALKQFIKKEK